MEETRVAEATRTPPPPEVEPVPGRGTALLPLAFVILSLALLVVVPILTGRRTEALQEQIENVAEPALDEVDNIQLQLALQMSALRGFLVTGQEPFLERYRLAWAEERRAFARLYPLVARLGADVLDRFVELRTLDSRWHTRIAEAEILHRRLAPPRFIESLPFEEALFEETLAAANRLNDAINQAVDLRRDAIAEAERLELALTGVLVLLALASALVVFGLGRRVRSLALRLGSLAERLRHVAREEIALREAARVLAAARTVPEVQRKLADSAVDVVGAKGAFIERVVAEGQEVEITEASGSGAPVLGVRVSYADSLTKAALERKEPAFVHDAADAGPLPAYLAESCGPCSALVVPLVSMGEALGALVLLREPDQPRFQASDVGRARILADLGSLALRKLFFLEEAERRRQEAERSVEARARLMRGISHDLKNPLGAIDGYAQLLESGVRGELTPEQRESVQRIRRAVRSALSIIDDLVELSRAEAGQLRIERAPTRVDELARESAEEHRAEAEAAGLDLRVEVPEELPPVSTDAKRVRQILGNLLSNAVKYTPEGGQVSVRAEVKADGPAQRPGRWLAITVSDTGPGIPEEARERIFEEFYRLPTPEGREEEGAGLGLPISRRLARMLGGDVTLVSEVGRGSAFTLWLPLDTAEEEAPQARAA